MVLVLFCFMLHVAHLLLNHGFTVFVLHVACFLHPSSTAFILHVVRTYRNPAFAPFTFYVARCTGSYICTLHVALPGNMIFLLFLTVGG